MDFLLVSSRNYSSFRIFFIFQQKPVVVDKFLTSANFEDPRAASIRITTT